MEIPQFSQSPSTPFLQDIARLGYNSWFSFDFTEETSFFKALGHGIVAHSTIHYTAIGTFIDRKWTPKVNSLLSVLTQFPAANRCENPNYWREIGSKASQFAIQFFREAGKTEQAAMIQRGKCPGRDNTVAYKSLANHLNLCLTWYENTSNGPITHAFYNSETRNEFCLFINIAQDSNRLYLLFHKDFQFGAQVDGPRFPYYMLSLIEGGPLLLGQGSSREGTGDRGSAERLEELAKKLVEIVQVQAKVIREEYSSVKPSTVELIGGMRERVNAVNALMRLSNLGTLDSADMQAVLALTAVAPESQQSQQHTVKNCAQFSHIDSHYMPHQEHYFHVSCIRKYIRSLGLVYPENPRCPICESDLPESFLALCPEIDAKYNQEKIRRIDETRPDLYPQSSPNPHFSKPGYVSPNYTLPQQMIVCVNCGGSYAPQYFVQHGCLICFGCGIQALNQLRGVCQQCGYRIPAVDEQTLRNYQSQMQRRQ
jgi:hypothetical protein